MSMTATQILDGSEDGATSPIDVRNALNVSITIHATGYSAGSFIIQGSDNVARCQTEKDTGLDQGIPWADITSMVDSSDELTLTAGQTVVVSLFNPPAFIRIMFDQTSGDGSIELFITGRG